MRKVNKEVALNINIGQARGRPLLLDVELHWEATNNDHIPKNDWGAGITQHVYSQGSLIGLVLSHPGKFGKYVYF